MINKKHISEIGIRNILKSKLLTDGYLNNFAEIIDSDTTRRLVLVVGAQRFYIEGNNMTTIGGNTVVLPPSTIMKIIKDKDPDYKILARHINNMLGYKAKQMGDIDAITLAAHIGLLNKLSDSSYNSNVIDDVEFLKEYKPYGDVLEKIKFLSVNKSTHGLSNGWNTDTTPLGEFRVTSPDDIYLLYNEGGYLSISTAQKYTQLDMLINIVYCLINFVNIEIYTDTDTLVEPIVSIQPQVEQTERLDKAESSISLDGSIVRAITNAFGLDEDNIYSQLVITTGNKFRHIQLTTSHDSDQPINLYNQIGNNTWVMIKDNGDNEVSTVSEINTLLDEHSCQVDNDICRTIANSFLS